MPERMRLSHQAPSAGHLSQAVSVLPVLCMAAGRSPTKRKVVIDSCLAYRAICVTGGPAVSS